MTVEYHPDPEINAEVAAEAAENERADVKIGHPPRRWMCPGCGASHDRGFFPLGSDAHRCLGCGYGGTGGVLWDPATEPAPNPSHGPSLLPPLLYEQNEIAYLNLLRRILSEGSRRTDRTGTGTISVFGAQLRFDLRLGFPLLTTKKVPIQPVVRELLWFIRGSTNTRDLGTKIWDAWASEDGDLGPIYGYQWRRWGCDYDRWADYQRRLGVYLSRTKAEQDALERSYEERAIRLPSGEVGVPGEVMPHFPATIDDWHGGPPEGVDQLADAIDTIKRNPDSRRIIVCSWNASDVPRMALPPCHLLYQMYVDAGHLDLQLYQRSADMSLGVPFNIASYALLLSMIARECGLVPRYFIHTFGDAHIYLNHEDGIREQLSRAVKAPPRLVLANKPVFEQTEADIALEDYDPHPPIRFQVSV